MMNQIEFLDEKINESKIKEILLQRNKEWVKLKDGSSDINGSLRTIIIGCIDSRVPIEKIFQAKPGELLVLKNAGNVITEDILRSILVGIYELGAKTIVVMGHTRCGMAIKDNKEKIDHLLHEMGPHSIEKLKEMVGTDIIEWFGFFEQEGWESNVHSQARQLKNVLEEIVSENYRPIILKALYDLDSGEVRFID